jgi:hypothetical protein
MTKKRNYLEKINLFKQLSRSLAAWDSLKPEYDQLQLGSNGNAWDFLGYMANIPGSISKTTFLILLLRIFGRQSHTWMAPPEIASINDLKPNNF